MQVVGSHGYPRWDCTFFNRLIETKTSRCGKSLGISPGNTRTARPFEMKLVCFFSHVTHQKLLNLQSLALKVFCLAMINLKHFWIPLGIKQKGQGLTALQRP